MKVPRRSNGGNGTKQKNNVDWGDLYTEERKDEIVNPELDNETPKKTYIPGEVGGFVRKPKRVEGGGKRLYIVFLL